MILQSQLAKPLELPQGTRSQGQLVSAIVELLLDHGADAALFSEADVRDWDFG